MTSSKSLDERFDKLEIEMKRSSFRENIGLGNEVNYRIFDYRAADELHLRERISYLKNKNENPQEKYKIVVFDLYDIMIEILKEKNYLEKCFEMEKKRGFQKVSGAVSNLMRITSTDGLIIEYIKERIPENAVVFLTGIGKCYPIIRSHTVLNNLHQAIDDVPVVMFYPGEYSGQELILFGEQGIKDDNYYRAFKFE